MLFRSKRHGRKSNIDDQQAAAIIRKATDILNRESGPNPFLVHEDLQDVMQKYVGIIREKDELEQALRELLRIRYDTEKVKAHASSQYNPGWNEAIDLQNLLITAEAVARAALMREESRGAHTRMDYPDEREEWLKYNIVLRKGSDGSMVVAKVERPAPPEELRKIAYAAIEALEGAHG